MIDPRFSLTQHTEYKHLFHLQFSVFLPTGRYYIHQYPSILDLCKQQYPELEFDYQGNYSARFPDKQYANCVQCKVKNSYVEELVFSMPLGLDTIMAATCSFKKAVPPIEYLINPADLIHTLPDDFYKGVENLYSVRYKISLRIKAVSWQFLYMDGDNPVYNITPTDYDYI